MPAYRKFKYQLSSIFRCHPWVLEALRWLWALRSSFSIEKKKGISHYFGPILAKLKRKKKTTTFKKKQRI